MFVENGIPDFRGFSSFFIFSYCEKLEVQRKVGYF